MTISFNAAEMKKITDAKVSFKGLQPVINFAVKEDKIAVGVDNTLMQVIGSIKIDAVVNPEVTFSLHYTQVNDILAKFGKRDIFLEYKEKEITLRDNKFNFRLRPLASGFSSIIGAMKAFKGTNEMVFTVDAFKDIFGRMTDFVATTDNRPALRGINMKSVDEKLHVAATDTKKLSYHKIDDATAYGMKEPPSGISINLDQAAICKVISEAEDTIIMKWNERSAVFEYGNIVLMSQLIEGKYPKYEQLTLPSYKYNTVVDKAELLEAISMVSTMLKGGVMLASISHRIGMHFGKEGIRVYATAEGGDSDSILEYANDIEDYDMFFNADYLTTILDKIETPKVELHFESDKAPVKVVSHQGDKNNYFIFMPLTNE